MVQFSNEAHAETYEKVAEMLPDFFDEMYHEEDNGHFYVRYGSTVLEISVEGYGPKEAVVTIMSYCVQGTDVDEELRTGLLEANHSLPFGSFSLVGDDIFFSYSLFGRDLTPRGLLGAIAAVADVADEYDDRIVARYGGQTALERIQDTGGRSQRSSAVWQG